MTPTQGARWPVKGSYVVGNVSEGAASVIRGRIYEVSTRRVTFVARRAISGNNPALFGRPQRGLDVLLGRKVQAVTLEVSLKYFGHLANEISVVGGVLDGGKGR
jgi:hypothetical protein